MTMWTNLDPRVEIAFDHAGAPHLWTWTDVTQDLLGGTPVQITGGRQDEQSRMQPSECRFTLRDPDGHYVPGNPHSPHSPNVQLGTPLRVRIAGSGVSYVHLNGATDSYVSTPDTPSLDVTGDLDVRIDVETTPGMFVGLMSKAELSGNFSWAFNLTNVSTLNLRWSVDGSAFESLSSTAPVDLASGRVALRATLDTDDGGNHTVRFYTADSLEGPWTQLGAADTRAGTTSIFSGAAPVLIGHAPFTDNLTGDVYGAEIRDGIDGTVVADPDFTGLSPDDIQVTDSVGNVWSIQADAEPVDPEIRFRGSVAEWLPEWPYGDLSTTDDDGEVVDPGEATVSVTAARILRRMEQGAKTLRSVMYRGLTDFSVVPAVAYWPGEDGDNATQIAAAVGTAPMSITGAVDFAAYSGFLASDPLPQFDGAASAVAEVPAAAATGELRVFGLFHLPESGVPTPTRLLTISTTGTAAHWAIELNANDGAMRPLAWDREWQPILAGGYSGFDLNDKKWLGGIWLRQDGGSVRWQLFMFEEGTSTGFVSEGIIGPYTLGAATRISIGGSGNLNDTAIGHIAVFNQDTSTVIWDTALNLLRAWAGETAGERMTRLTAEEDVPFTLIGNSDDTELVGAQASSTLLELLREAADDDGGFLSETIDRLGLTYRTREDLYNQTPRLLLDAASAPGGDIVNPFAPALDDQAARNDVTVSRRGGSSAREFDEADIEARGLYDEQITLNVASDGQLGRIAGWRLHLGTWRGMRYPSVSPAINVNQALLDAWMTLRLGDLAEVSNLPPQHAAASVLLMMQGYTESWLPERVDVQINATPGALWTVATVSDGTDEQRVDTDGSIVAEPFTSGTDTELRVATEVGPTWTEDPAEFPIAITAGGIDLTVTAATTVNQAPNGEFEADVDGWEPLGGTLTHSTTQAHSGTGSGLLTPNGVTAVVRARTTDAAEVSVQGSREYTYSAWVYSADGYTVDTSVRFFDENGAVLEFEQWAIQAVPADTWTELTATRVSPAGAAKAELNVNQRTVPAVTDLLWIDDVAFTGPVQEFTVAPGAIAKQIPVGVDVRLTQPMIIGQ